MKEVYENAVLEIVLFEAEDVITYSGGENTLPTEPYQG